MSVKPTRMSAIMGNASIRMDLIAVSAPLVSDWTPLVSTAKVSFLKG